VNLFVVGPRMPNRCQHVNLIDNAACCAVPGNSDFSLICVGIYGSVAQGARNPFGKRTCTPSPGNKGMASLI
jgi:hypothetical protein